MPGPDFDRAYNDLINVGVQHQLFAGFSISAAYYHRNYLNIRWTDNVLTTFADYTPLPLADPRDNGETLMVYNLSPQKNGLVSNVDLNSDNTMSTTDSTSP